MTSFAFVLIFDVQILFLLDLLNPRLPNECWGWSLLRRVLFFPPVSDGSSQHSCDSSHCSHHGTCHSTHRDGHTHYSCDCHHGYYGDKCEIGQKLRVYFIYDHSTVTNIRMKIRFASQKLITDTHFILFPNKNYCFDGWPVKTRTLQQSNIKHCSSNKCEDLFYSRNMQLSLRVTSQIKQQ